MNKKLSVVILDIIIDRKSSFYAFVYWQAERKKDVKFVRELTCEASKDGIRSHFEKIKGKRRVYILIEVTTQ